MLQLHLDNGIYEEHLHYHHYSTLPIVSVELLCSYYCLLTVIAPEFLEHLASAFHGCQLVKRAPTF